VQAGIDTTTPGAWIIVTECEQFKRAGPGGTMDDDKQRQVAGRVMAHGFLLEILMARYLSNFSTEGQTEIVDAILKTGMRTDHFEGLINDEQTAELFSDVVVKSHQELKRLVSQSLKRVARDTKG
jgi:hypothetical protein